MEAFESRKSHGKIGDCEQSTTVFTRISAALTNKDGGSSMEAFESRKSHGKIGDCEQSTTVFTRISAVALIEFFASQMRRLFKGGAY